MSTTQSVAIQQMLKNWNQAIKDKNLAAIGEHYSSDVRAFDAVGPLQFEGKEAYLAHWKACTEMCAGDTLFEMQEPHLELADSIAFGHFLCHCGGPDEKGEMHQSWMRVTQCYRKQNGRWLIAHEHFSLPFDPYTGNTVFDLTP